MKKSRISLVPLMDKQCRKLLKTKTLTTKELIAVLQVAAKIEKAVGGEDDEWGKDLPDA